MPQNKPIPDWVLGGVPLMSIQAAKAGRSEEHTSELQSH